MERRILHLQVASFSVSVQRVRDPALRRRPVAILTRRTARSVVAATSQEARDEGVRTGMCLSEARALCRGLTVVPPDPALQARAATALTRLASAYSPLVEPTTGGRLFVDLTGTSRLLGATRDTAARIQKEVTSRLSLPCSIGLSSNKLVSGVACHVTPPQELSDVHPGDEASFLSPLPAALLPAVRLVRQRRLLSDLNLRQVIDVAALPLSRLLLAFHGPGYSLYRQARGRDDAPVRPPALQPAVREEETLARESLDDDTLRSILFLLVERSGRRLRQSGRRAGTAGLALRTADGQRVGRQVRLPSMLSGDRSLFRCLEPALEALTVRRVRVRWMELILSGLRDRDRQMTMFCADEDAQDRALSSALDQVRRRYGQDAVRRRGPSSGVPS
jgi:DNA polymerase-4